MDPEENVIEHKTAFEWARRFPNIIHPRFEDWYENWTWLSPTSTTNNLFTARGGANWTPLAFARRAHADDNTSSRTTSYLFFPAWPYERLAGSSTTSDSIVGTDYMHLPMKLYRDLDTWSRANWNYAQMDSVNILGYLRTLAWKHTFTIGNNSKHTLIIAYRAVPDYTLDSYTDITDSAIYDMRGRGFKYITIPGVEDSGDRTKRASFTITQNMAHDLKEYYGNQSDMNDYYSTLQPRYSPWTPLRLPGTSTLNPVKGPIPFMENPNTGEAPIGTHAQVFSTPIQMYAKYVVPVDVGVTSTGGTAGELTGNGFSIHVSSIWKMEWIQRVMGRPLQYDVTTGPRIKAFPSQVV